MFAALSPQDEEALFQAMLESIIELIRSLQRLERGSQGDLTEAVDARQARRSRREEKRRQTEEEQREDEMALPGLMKCWPDRDLPSLLSQANRACSGPARTAREADVSTLVQCLAHWSGARIGSPCLLPR